MHKDVDTSSYTAIQQKSVEVIREAKSISQFLDRDAHPTFAATVAIPSFQKFIREPESIGSVLTSMQEQAKSIYED